MEFIIGFILVGAIVSFFLFKKIFKIFIVATLILSSVIILSSDHPFLEILHETITSIFGNLR